jgi:hypothetical protein
VSFPGRAHFEPAALRVTPRQLFEASRLADRHGPAFAEELAGGRVLLLLATGRQDEPDLALELDAHGQVVARQFLELAHRDDDDPCADFGEEQELPSPVDLSHARPGQRCTCPSPRNDDGTCGICGHVVAGAAEVFSAA